MARFKAGDLQEMIRTIVRQEIREVVSTTINEVLSERYLKEVARRVSEAATISRPRGVASLEIMGDDAVEEEPPEPLDNDSKWPFEQHPIKKEQLVRESRDPMEMFFEGTRPLADLEKEADDAVVVKTDRAIATPEGQNTVEVWRKLAEGMDRKAVQARPMQVSPEEQLRRLEEKRRALEVKAK
jgi:hypothetical protein